MGGVSRIPAVSVEYSFEAPLEAQVLERRRADRTGAGRHPAALERVVGGVRVADLRVAAPSAEIGDGYGHQVVFRFAAIPMDRAHQYLAAGTRRHLGRAAAILAGLRHARSEAARRELGRLVVSGSLGLAAVICNHAVSIVLFSARWRGHDRARAALDPPGRRPQG